MEHMMLFFIIIECALQRPRIIILVRRLVKLIFRNWNEILDSLKVDMAWPMDKYFSPYRLSVA